MLITDRPLVCALDFSEGSEAALLRAADLAQRLHVPLHLLHAAPSLRSEHGVTPVSEPPQYEVENRILAFANCVLGRSSARDIRPVRHARVGGYAADVIVDYASEVNAGLLVLGTHGRRGVRHLLIGSIAEDVVRRAPCPVLTVPNAAGRTAPGPDAPVLVPVDFSAPNQHALGLAKTFAALFDAPVHLVHVLLDAGPYPPFYLEGGMLPPSALEEAYAEARVHLRRFDAEAGNAPAVRYHILNGVPHREIATLTNRGEYGLVVMATHGLTGLQHALIGSVTERTLRRVHCPVLSVRMSEAASSDSEAHTEAEG